MAVNISGDFLAPQPGQVYDFGVTAPVAPVTANPMLPGQLMSFVMIGGAAIILLALLPDKGRH